MPTDETSLEFECPNCHEPVDPDWKACPSCAVEFLPPEDEPAAAAAPAPAPAPAPPPPTPAAVKVEAPVAVSAPTPPPRKVDSIVIPPGSVPPKAPPKAAPSAPAPPKAAAKPRRSARVGGPLGMVGILLAIAGDVGAIIVANWDTLVLGAGDNYVGSQQLIGIEVTAAIAIVGVLVVLVGSRRARRPLGTS